MSTTGARRTSRLCLEPIGPELVDDLLTVHSDPSVELWYGKWTRSDALREAAVFAAAWERDGAHKWLAYELATGAVVGRGGLSFKLVDGEPRWETGWALRGEFWGRGYASEIGRESFAFGFGELGAAEIVAFTEAYNQRSRAVMERIGMRYSRDITHRGEPFALYTIDRPEII